MQPIARAVRGLGWGYGGRTRVISGQRGKSGLPRGDRLEADFEFDADC